MILDDHTNNRHDSNKLLLVKNNSKKSFFNDFLLLLINKVKKGQSISSDFMSYFDLGRRTIDHESKNSIAPCMYNGTSYLINIIQSKHSELNRNIILGNSS